MFVACRNTGTPMKLEQVDGDLRRQHPARILQTADRNGPDRNHQEQVRDDKPVRPDGIAPEEKQEQAGECHDQRGLLQRDQRTDLSDDQHGEAGERDRECRRRSPVLACGVRRVLRFDPEDVGGDERYGETVGVHGFVDQMRTTDAMTSL